jgi:cell division transport system permease protein
MRVWFRLHGMAVAAAMRRLLAQPAASLVAIIVIALAIAAPLLGAMLLKSLAAAASGLDTDPHMNVYLSLEATDADVKRIESTLRANADVTSVRFVSRTQALEELKATSHLAELLANLEKNPLPHAFTVRTKTADPARMATLRGELMLIPKVDQAVADFAWAEKLARAVRFADRALALVAALLAAGVLFIVGHLIRLQVLTRREEIEVSQLVGATAADVRRPFLYHGALQGLAAGGMAVGLAWLIVGWLNTELLALTSSYSTEFKMFFPDLATSLWVVAGVGMLGWIGAWASVSRELRRFSARS